MRPLARAFLLVLVAAPAAAQDAPPPAPAKEPAQAGSKEPAADAAAKRERKCSPEAEAVVTRYEKLLHLPSGAGVKTFEARGEVESESIGGRISLVPRWSEERGFDLGVEFSDELRAAFPSPEMSATVEAEAKNLMTLLLRPVFGGFRETIAESDLALREEKGLQVLDAEPIDPASPFERLRLSFGADGLLETATVVPRVNPNSPNAASMAGAEYDIAFRHEKRGERHVVSAIDVVTPNLTLESKAGYYELERDLYLPKEITFTWMFSPTPESVRFHDYVVDGKAVEATAAAKDAKAPAAGTSKDAATPNDIAPQGPEHDTK